MDEVTGPVIAVALVLCAVFVPCAFISGRHRAVLPPVRRDDRRLDGHLGVQLADPEPGAGGHPLEAPGSPQRPAHAGARRPARLVLPPLQRGLRRAATNLYIRLVGGLLRISLLALLIYGGLLV